MVKKRSKWAQKKKNKKERKIPPKQRKTTEILTLFGVWGKIKEKKK